MGIPLLNDIVIIFALAIGILCLCHYLRIPAVVGFLITGVLAGPHGLGLVKAVKEVEILAQIGVILLLFTIGMEFSLKELYKIKKSLLVGGSIQVGLTIVAVVILALIWGKPVNQAAFMGFLLSLSSTAIVLKILQDKAQVESPHGRKALAILIFQDLIVVPMILFTPVLAGGEEGILKALGIFILKGIAIIAFVAVSAYLVVPQLLFRIAKTRSREIFMLSLVAICFAVAWLTSSIGLSLALGAFLAGLIISRSEYSNQALSNIFPFRDVFTSFFFVSVGMLLDIRILAVHPYAIFSIMIGVLLFKSFIAALAIMLIGFPMRTAILGGLALGQVGEFAFILSQTGIKYGLLPENVYQIFLAVSIMTMALTPFIIMASPKIADFILKVPVANRFKNGLRGGMALKSKAATKSLLKNHLVIIGFGVNGKNLAKAAKVAGIPYIIIEMNPETVRSERSKGEPIFYGDASQEAVLDHAGLRAARVAVLAISDHAATRRIVSIARKLNPTLHIIARTVYIQEVKPLFHLGADEIVPEEFETSVEIFTRVLVKYLVPKEDIDKFVAEVRSGAYEMFRSQTATSASLNDLKVHLPNVEISAVKIKENSSVITKSLAEIELRRKYGITLLAIRRNSEILSNPDADTKLCAEDVLIVLGPRDKIAGLSEIFYNA
jgi:monovalent cation:H+ antiporter-2, CPA2 family